MTHATSPQGLSPESSRLPELRIRRAEAADAAALSVLGARTFRATFVEGFAIPYPKSDLEPFLADSFAAERFAGAIADPAHGVWVAQAGDGALVAYATAGPCTLPFPEVRPQDGELKRLYLDASVQGAGLAPRLMQTVLDWLDPKGGRRLWLGVWSGNLRAQRFYARYGFEKAGEYDYAIGASRDREFILRRG